MGAQKREPDGNLMPKAQYTPPTRRNCQVESRRRCARNSRPVVSNLPTTSLQCESKNNPPHQKFSDIFPKRLGIFSPNFTCLINVPIYAGLQIFIQLPATLTKLCHIKHDHHNVLKMSTIDRNARWVVALNMA